MTIIMITLFRGFQNSRDCALQITCNNNNNDNKVDVIIPYNLILWQLLFIQI